MSLEKLQEVKENFITTAKSLIDTNLPKAEYGNRFKIDLGLVYALWALSTAIDIHPTVMTTAALVFAGEGIKNFVLEAVNFKVGTNNILQNPQ
jgi:hypothetical protein